MNFEGVIFQIRFLYDLNHQGRNEDLKNWDERKIENFTL